MGIAHHKLWTRQAMQDLRYRKRRVREGLHQCLSADVVDELLIVIGRSLFSGTGQHKLPPGDPFDSHKAIVVGAWLDSQLVDTTSVGPILQEQSQPVCGTPKKSAAGNVVERLRHAECNDQCQLFIDW